MRALLALLTVAATACLPGQASGQLPAQSAQQREAWRACVLSAADRYTKATDPADIVARAALISCKADSVKFATQLGTDGISAEAGNQIHDLVERSLTDEAILRIIEARAKW